MSTCKHEQARGVYVCGDQTVTHTNPQTVYSAECPWCEIYVNTQHIALLIRQRDEARLWIPVADRLPPYGQRVLITRMYGAQESTRLVEEAYRDHTNSSGEWWCVQRYGNIPKVMLAVETLNREDFRVLAWKPLPEPFAAQ